MGRSAITGLDVSEKRKNGWAAAGIKPPNHGRAAHSVMSVSTGGYS